MIENGSNVGLGVRKRVFFYYWKKLSGRVEKIVNVKEEVEKKCNKFDRKKEGVSHDERQ